MNLVERCFVELTNLAPYCQPNKTNQPNRRILVH
jgi:hypothetical protein